MDKNEIALRKFYLEYIDRLLFRGRRYPDNIPAYLYALYCAVERAPKAALNSTYGACSMNTYNEGGLSIENVIFNDPATIVFWSDGTKTVVKAQTGDTFDPEKGLAMAISKRVYGNSGNYYNALKKWLPDE